MFLFGVKMMIARSAAHPAPVTNGQSSSILTLIMWWIHNIRDLVTFWKCHLTHSHLNENFRACSLYQISNWVLCFNAVSILKLKISTNGAKWGDDCEPRPRPCHHLHSPSVSLHILYSQFDWLDALDRLLKIIESTFSQLPNLYGERES